MKASHSIAAAYRERIASGELSAGQPLPVESELTDELGVSKGVVREALRILESEGLVVVRRGLGGGPRVRHPSISDAAKGMGVYLQIGDVAVSDVWVARDRIIANAVERLALERTDEAMVTLDEAVGELTDLVGNVETYNLQLLAVGEVAVRLAGNATDHVLVRSLRHIIAAELEMATRAVYGLVIGLDRAVVAEDEVARAWTEVSRHIRGKHAKAARRAFQRQADRVREGVQERMTDMTVGDGFPAASAPPADRARSTRQPSR